MKLVIGLKSGSHVPIDYDFDLDHLVRAYLLLSEPELIRATMWGTSTQIAVRRDSVEYITDGEAI